LTAIAEETVACCAGERWGLFRDWPHEVSTCGRFRSIDRPGPGGVPRLGQLLPLQPDRRKGKGYLYAMLRDGGRRLKVPVAAAVLEVHDRPRPGRRRRGGWEFEACHANDVRDDNHLTNLSWGHWLDNRAQMWTRRRSVTTRPGDITGGAFPQDGGRAAPSRHRVTGDGAHGTGRFPFRSSLPFIFLSVRSSLRSLRSLRSGSRRPS
jgi:hypothetical protein